MESNAYMTRATSGVNCGTRFRFDCFNKGGIIGTRDGLLEDGSNNDIDHIFLDISQVRVGINNTEPQCTVDISANDAIIVPKGSEAQRPSNIPGMIRYNTDTNIFEGYSTTGRSLGGGSGD